MPTPPRRRLNPDQAPFNRLPVISYDLANDYVHVIRGNLNAETLTAEHRRQFANHPGTRHAVFTNRLGDHLLHRAGALVSVGIDYTRVADLPAAARALPLNWTDQELLECPARHRRDPHRFSENCDVFTRRDPTAPVRSRSPRTNAPARTD